MINDILQWIGIAIAALSFIFRNKFFVTPAELERVRSGIEDKADSKYVSLQTCTLRNEHITELFQYIRKDVSELHKTFDTKFDKMSALIYDLGKDMRKL